MAIDQTRTGSTAHSGLLRRLLRDRSGNTFAMVAAAITPMLAMVGGGIDMGRSYLSQSRLQQACDAGVLAARKKLGSTAAVDGIVPGDVATTGNRFFNLNFRTGAYGTKDRKFMMSLEEDYSITGEARVEVPTTIMQVFGFDNVPVDVKCSAQLAMSNTDIMMVLDTTGSMSLTNPGDTDPRITILKDVVAGFHAQIEAAKGAETRVRYGFVPYSTNVNVGALLDDAWVIGDDWEYQSREARLSGEISTKTYTQNWNTVSGTATENGTIETYDATYNPAIDKSGEIDDGKEGYFTCNTPAPSGDYTNNDIKLSETTEAYFGPPPGTRFIEYRRRTLNGSRYWISRNGDKCHIKSRTYNNLVQTYERVTDPIKKTLKEWEYDQFKVDVTNWRSEVPGCIEERATYEISDYTNVDLTQALDLDLDLVPTSDEDTKWKPSYPKIIYARAMTGVTSGSFSKKGVKTKTEFIRPYDYDVAACPAPSRKLAEISAAELSTYLNTLTPVGQTYHDIGMIWGGRLISPSGLFAAENANINGRASNRHLIFLTDGETEPYDVAYSSYGLEPLDARRWDQGSALTLTQTVEKRFSFACEEVKKRNVTVWVIGFGTTMTDMLRTCAGDGHWFQADDAAQLNNIFNRIAKTIGELRVSK